MNKSDKNFLWRLYLISRLDKCIFFLFGFEIVFFILCLNAVYIKNIPLILISAIIMLAFYLSELWFISKSNKISRIFKDEMKEDDVKDKLERIFKDEVEE